MVKKKESMETLSQTEIAQGVWDLRLKTEFAKTAQPGQFVGVYLNNPARLLPRPISICLADAEKEELRLVYRISGEGTAELSTYPAHKSLDLLGVLGNGYPIEGLKGKKILLLGGGIGIPPLLFAAQRLQEEAPVMMMGYRNGDTFLAEEFQKYGKLYLATEDGSVGVKGNVMDVYRENPVDFDVILACGPLPMLRAVKRLVQEENQRKQSRKKAYLSLEERMACGVGACLGCVTKTTKQDAHSRVKNARICTDGPVFEAEEVEI